MKPRCPTIPEFLLICTVMACFAMTCALLTSLKSEEKRWEEFSASIQERGQGRISKDTFDGVSIISIRGEKVWLMFTSSGYLIDSFIPGFPKEETYMSLTNLKESKQIEVEDEPASSDHIAKD